jgi:predicted ester cyclase
MPPKENLENVKRAVTRFNAGDIEGYLDMFDKSVVFHGMPRRLKPGIGGLRDYYVGLRQGFPDMRLGSEDMVTEGEKVAHRYTFYGTHKGEYMGVAPSMKLVVSPGIVIHLFKGVKCVETWHSSDSLGFVTQMGVAHPLSVK